MLKNIRQQKHFETQTTTNMNCFITVVYNIPEKISEIQCQTLLKLFVTLIRQDLHFSDVSVDLR